MVINRWLGPMGLWWDIEGDKVIRGSYSEDLRWKNLESHWRLSEPTHFRTKARRAAFWYGVNQGRHMRDAEVAALEMRLNALAGPGGKRDITKVKVP